MATGDDDILPSEIWRDILHRLPVKSILRCRSVCKSWYSLVSCPEFISDYSDNKNDNRFLLRLCDNRCQNKSFTSLDESFKESGDYDDVPETLLGAKIIGSCNGLICLYTYKIDSTRLRRITFLIWNPAIRKTVELPNRTTRAPHIPYIGFGFGFDPKTNDHKVVFGGDANVFDIFDLKKGVWRGISPILHSCRFRCSYPDCYVNGAVHWTGYKERHDASSYMIIMSFNMIEERFRVISMPNCAEFRAKSGASFRSVAFSGLIYVMVWKKVGNEYDGMSQTCSIWAMKEYGVTESWTKVYDIDLSCAHLEFCPDLFCLWDDDQVLMVHKHPVDKKRQNMVLYNTKKGEYKWLFTSTKCIMNMLMYKESLFLMSRNVSTDEGSNVFFY